MNRKKKPLFGLVLLAATTIGCSGSSGQAAATSEPSSPLTVPSTSRSPEEAAGDAALQTYTSYWVIGTQAEAAPRRKDWRPDLARYMADPALTVYVKDIENLASIPAHAVGEYRHSPKVTSVSLASPARVVVMDCLDATDDHLVSDKPGDAGANLDNPDQPKRYQVESQLVRYPNPDRWLIQLVQPRLEQPC